MNILLELEPPGCAGKMTEATVRLPPRSSKWVGVYTGPEPGKQVARSTGLTDREAALALVKKWEAEARQQRASSSSPQKPVIRVGRIRGAEPGTCPLTQSEVAAILNMSERTVREIERRAFEKLRRHPRLRQLWREHLSGEWEEPSIYESLALSEAEIAALLGLAETALEIRAMAKLLAWIGVSPAGASSVTQ